MVKVIWIARFRKGMSRDDARAHWRDTHGPLGADVPGLDRYVQTHLVGPLPPETTAPGFDGYSSGWYADDAAYARSMASPEWAAIGADSDNLFDTPYFWGMSAFVDEHVVHEPPAADAVKVAAVVRWREGAGSSWPEDLVVALGNVPGLVGLVLNVAGDAIGVQGRTKDLELRFDAVAEYWFEDHTALVRGLASPRWRWAQDSRTDPERTMWGLMEERVVKDVVAYPAGLGV